MYDGELTARQFVDCGVGVLASETADSVIEPLLTRLVEAADRWAPASQRDELLTRGRRPVHHAGGRTRHRRIAALRALAQSATTPEQLDSAGRPRDRPGPPVATAHPARRAGPARRVRSRAAAGRGPEPRRLDERRPRPRRRPVAPRRRPQAWQAVMVDRKIPPGVLGRVGRAFWRPGQEAAADAVRREVPRVAGQISETGMLWALSLSGRSTPRSVARTASSTGSRRRPVTTG